MAFSISYIISLAALCTVNLVLAQTGGNSNGGTLSRLPGGQTSAAALASSSDGMSRYLAPDGPIQPAITAIGTLPARASEQLNNGITRISSGFNNQAQRLSQAAGQNGQIRMPGLDTAESHMPESYARMGQSVHGMIRKKNQFIMSQAEQGIQAGNRLGQMMRSGLQVRSSGHSMIDSMSGLMEGPAQMISSAQEFMTKSASTLQSQAKEHLNGAMGRMGNMQGMGRGMMDQVQGVSRTLQNGVQGVMGQITQTGQELMGQLQGNHNKNMKSMSGVLESLQGSMGSMHKNMHSNMDGVMEHAQNTAQQLTSSIQKAAEAPMKVFSSLTEHLGSMMGGMMSMKGGSSHGGGGGGGKGGRY